MQTLKPLIGLTRFSAGIYYIEVEVDVENGLIEQPSPGPVYGRPIPITPPSHPDDPDTYNGTETLIQIGFSGTVAPGIRRYKYAFPLDRNKIKQSGDIRVRVTCAHPGHHHDGTSTAHYGDPKN